MRLYQVRDLRRVLVSHPLPPTETQPGMTLTETIDQFFAEGVVPDLLPADLGTDAPDEIDGNDYPLVDPMGDIRSDPMELRERLIVKAADDKFVKAYADTGLDDFGNPPAPPPPAPPSPATSTLTE